MWDLTELQERLRDGRRRGRPASRPAGHARLGETPAAARIALGADHGGFALKEHLKSALLSWGYEVDDVGTDGTAAVDYPDFAVAVARRVASATSVLGVMIDGAGLGSCMAVNKVAGARGATCHNEATVRNSREHNDANVLVLGSGVVNPGYARRLLRLWLETPHAGGRHARRVDKINALDAQRR